MTIVPPEPTRVGVLLVHGIGEQGRFEHLEAEVRHIARAIKSREDRLRGGRTTVEVIPATAAQVRANQMAWLTNPRSALRVVVRPASGTPLDIHFHEVWWADIGERPTLRRQLSFWLWGLTMWLAAGKDRSSRPGFARLMFKPILATGPLLKFLPVGEAQATLAGGRLKFIHRTALFFIGALFLVAFVSLRLVDFFLQRFTPLRLTLANTMIAYLGDIMLYDQRSRSDGGTIDDLDQPPRIAIRRRAISAIADMATGNYDRWYILAHSLGTVAAFNALMEPATILPHYLDEKRWRRLVRGKLAGKARPSDTKPARDSVTTPPRPAWLAPDDDVVYRDQLFAKLRGLLTYGSPLEKFAALWPAIVPLNNDQAVFAADFEWINIWDVMDPVAGEIKSFDPAPFRPLPRSPAEPPPPKAAQVENLRYRAVAAPILLLSHIRYLAFHSAKADCLVSRVADWLVSGQDFNKAQTGRCWTGRTMAVLLRLLRLAQWCAIAAILTILAGAMTAGLFLLADSEVFAAFRLLSDLAAASATSWLQIPADFAAGYIAWLFTGYSERLDAGWWTAFTWLSGALGFSLVALTVVLQIFLGFGYAFLRREDP